VLPIAEIYSYYWSTASLLTIYKAQMIKSMMILILLLRRKVKSAGRVSGTHARTGRASFTMASFDSVPELFGNLSKALVQITFLTFERANYTLPELAFLWV